MLSDFFSLASEQDRAGLIKESIPGLNDLERAEAQISAPKEAREPRRKKQKKKKKTEEGAPGASEKHVTAEVPREASKKWRAPPRRGDASEEEEGTGPAQAHDAGPSGFRPS